MTAVRRCELGVGGDSCTGKLIFMMNGMCFSNSRTDFDAVTIFLSTVSSAAGVVKDTVD